MPIKELSTTEQIKILHDLDEQERIFDKNISLVKGDLYSLKYKHNVNVEPEPLSLIQESFRQQPTIEAIKTVTNEIKRATTNVPEDKPQVREIVATIPKEEPLMLKPVEEFEEEKESEENLILKKHNFPTEIEIEREKMHIPDVVVSISQYNKNILGQQLAQLTKKGLKDGPLYKSIQHEVHVLKAYRERLISNFDTTKVLIEKIGHGLKSMKIGKYYANVQQIKNGKLKIRKKNQSKIKGIDDMNISEGMKHLLLKRFNTKMAYSPEDLALYRRICDLTGHRPKKFSKLRDKIYVTDIKDAQNRLINAIGEIKAGNNHPEIRNEIVSLADFLLKNHKLTKDEYNNLMRAINE